MVDIAFNEFIEICKDLKENLLDRLGILTAFRNVPEVQFKSDPTIFLDFQNSSLLAWFVEILDIHDSRPAQGHHYHTGRTHLLLMNNLSPYNLLLTPEGRTTLYKDIEQGIKLAVMTRNAEHILKISKDDEYFHISGDSSLRDNVIQLLRVVENITNKLLSYRTILKLAFFVDELLDLRRKSSKDVKDDEYFHIVDESMTTLHKNIDSLLLFYIQNPFLRSLGLATLSPDQFLETLHPEAQDLFKKRYDYPKQRIDNESYFYENAVLSYLTCGEMVYLQEYYTLVKATSSEMSFFDCVSKLLKDKGSRPDSLTLLASQAPSSAAAAGTLYSQPPPPQQPPPPSR